jgi:hypothetical protein
MIHSTSDKLHVINSTSSAVSAAAAAEASADAAAAAAAGVPAAAGGGGVNELVSLEALRRTSGSATCA